MPTNNNTQIDETGKSAAWIARYGRDAMQRKQDEWTERLAEYRSWSPAQKRAYSNRCDDSDDQSMGVR